MRRITGCFVLFALFATPTVARTRMFCRFTGIEIVDCEEQRVTQQPVVQPDDCCERRVSTTPAPGTRPPEPVLPRAEVLAPSWSAPLPVQPSARSAQREVSLASAGPPLFLQEHALLI